MTLSEVMVTSGIFSLAIAGFMRYSIFAMRLNTIVGAKLGASDDPARHLAECGALGSVELGNEDAVLLQKKGMYLNQMNG